MGKPNVKLLVACITMCLLVLPLASCATPSETSAQTTAPTVKPTPSPTAEPTHTPLPSSSSTETPSEQPTQSPTPAPTAEPTPTLDPDGPQVLRLYFRSTKKLATEYDANLVKGEKNVEFFALPTDRASVEKITPRALVEKYWGEYRKDGYQIGYAVDITLKSGEVIHLNIRRPGDAPPADREPKYFSKFVEIYLYDSARKDPDGDYGTWHLQERLLKEGENVLITNIKFHAGSRYSEVASIGLTAYAYLGENCFDENGEYTGNLKCHVLISRQ